MTNVSQSSEDRIGGTMFKCVITREQAMDAIRGLLCYKHVSRALNVHYRFTECSLIYVPFWRSRAYVSGHADGYVDAGGYETATFVPVRRPFSQTLTWTMIADDTPGIGVRYLRNTVGEEVPYEASPGPAPKILVSRDDALAKGHKAMEKYAVWQLKKEDLYSRKISNIDVRPLGITLVFYPLWIVKYSYSKLAWRATIDGVTGELLAGGKVDDLLARCTVAGMLAGVFLVLASIILLINGWIGYALLVLITGPGHGIITDLLTFIRYGRAIAGDRLEGLLQLPRKKSCKRNGLAMLGMATGFLLMAFSIFGWGVALVTFYILANQGLAIYLLSGLFLCDMSGRIIGNVQGDR